jgi:hypothetical protein
VYLYFVVRTYKRRSIDLSLWNTSPKVVNATQIGITIPLKEKVLQIRRDQTKSEINFLLPVKRCPFDECCCARRTLSGKEKELRTDLCKWTNRAYDQNLFTVSSGAMSIRQEMETRSSSSDAGSSDEPALALFLITPTGSLFHARRFSLIFLQQFQICWCQIASNDAIDPLQRPIRNQSAKKIFKHRVRVSYFSTNEHRPEGDQEVVTKETDDNNMTTDNNWQQNISQVKVNCIISLSYWISCYTFASIFFNTNQSLYSTLQLLRKKLANCAKRRLWLIDCHARASRNNSISHIVISQ